MVPLPSMGLGSDPSAPMNANSATEAYADPSSPSTAAAPPPISQQDPAEPPSKKRKAASRPKKKAANTAHSDDDEPADPSLSPDDIPHFLLLSSALKYWTKRVMTESDITNGANHMQLYLERLADVSHSNSSLILIDY